MSCDCKCKCQEAKGSAGGGCLFLSFLIFAVYILGSIPAASIGGIIETDRNKHDSTLFHLERARESEERACVEAQAPTIDADQSRSLAQGAP
jgi:hypothetical protein